MKLHFTVQGSGPPLVILHGLLGSNDNWRSFASHLTSRFEVFLPDLPNHGLSPHASGMTYPSLALSVIEFIDTAVRGVPHLLGHSMGGKIAMQLALTHPEKLNSLLVVDIGAHAYGPRHRKILDGMLGLDLPLFATRKQIEEALAPAVPDLATRRFLLKNLALRPEGGFYWKIGLQEISQDYSALCKAITSPHPYDGPAAFFKGEDSDYLNDQDLPLVRQLFPRAVFYRIAHAGHWVQIENPEALLKSLNEFLASSDPTA